MDDININKLNREQSFDLKIERELGCYVYVLRDGVQPFYVGKGGGSGSGNARVLGHFEEARKEWGRPPEMLSAKIRRIHAIWRRGENVQWDIVRYGLPDESSALLVEASLIDFIGRNNLTNIQGGHETLGAGLLRSHDVYRLAAPPVAPHGNYEKVLIFNIEKALRVPGRTPYEATRGWWTNTRRHEDATLAVGVVRGVSVCVIEIERWLSWGDYIDTPPGDFDQSKGWGREKVVRRGFEGKIFSENTSHELLNKNYNHIIELAKGYWGYGNWLAVEFKYGEFKFLKGRPAKNMI